MVLAAGPPQPAVWVSRCHVPCDAPCSCWDSAGPARRGVLEPCGPDWRLDLIIAHAASMARRLLPSARLRVLVGGEMRCGSGAIFCLGPDVSTGAISGGCNSLPAQGRLSHVRPQIVLMFISAIGRSMEFRAMAVQSAARSLPHQSRERDG